MAAHRSDTEKFEHAMLLKLDERLAPRDVALLERCWARTDIDTVSLTPYQLAWLTHYKLVATVIVPSECIYIETTALGRSLVIYMRRGKAKAPCARVS